MSRYCDRISISPVIGHPSRDRVKIIYSAKHRLLANLHVSFFRSKTVGQNKFVKSDSERICAQSGHFALKAVVISNESIPDIREAGFRYESTSENDNG